MQEKNKHFLVNILIIAGAGLLFIPFLGKVHLFDWDEINFAESAREMIVTGDYLTVQIDFKPFWEKPPLFIWMQVLSMKIFGINEFAARFPNAICGIVTLLVLFNLGRKIKNAQFGMLWSLVYIGSILPFFYFKSGIIDPWFNLFIFLGVIQLARYFIVENKTKAIQAIWSALWIGMAILTKGPVAFLVFCLVLISILIWKKFRVDIRGVDILIYAGVVMFVGGFWFILQMFHGNLQTIIDFISYQAGLFSENGAGHGGFFGYHFVILLVGVFPASVFAIAGFGKLYSKEGEHLVYRHFMIILFWVVLILFSIVNTKIVHYSSLCYFPLTWLAAEAIDNRISHSLKFNTLIHAGLLGIGLLLIIVVSFFPIASLFKEKILATELIHDPFTARNFQADVSWPFISYGLGLILVLALMLYFIYIKKTSLKKAIIYLFAINVVFIWLCTFILTPRIEMMSQRANIEFFKSLQHKNVYFSPLGYKSYAHYFYGRKQKPVQDKAYDKEWLLTGDIDKNAYFSIKVHKKDKFLANYPELEVLYEKNGFVFCKRNHTIETITHD